VSAVIESNVSSMKYLESKYVMKFKLTKLGRNFSYIVSLESGIKRLKAVLQKLRRSKNTLIQLLPSL
jgi:hypothetical protein